MEQTEQRKRRTRAEIQAEKIERLARQQQVLEQRMKAARRDADKAAKQELSKAQTKLGKAICEGLYLEDAGQVESVIGLLRDDVTLGRVKAVLAPPGQTASDDPRGAFESGVHDIGRNAAAPDSRFDDAARDAFDEPSEQS